MPDDLWSDDEWRAAMSSADINDLPDEAFAYIEPGGKKDESGKTVPRSLRHFPVHDAAHTRNALARAPQSPFGDKAMPKILAAAKKFGIEVSESKSTDINAEVRAVEECPTCDGTGKIMDGHRDCPDCDGTGEVETKSAKPVRTIRVKKPRHRAGLASGLEVRHFATGKLECRDDGETNTLQLIGMPIVYDTPYQVRDIFGTFNETMKPGVVTDLLASKCDTRFLFNHSGLPLGRTTSGTLTLEDSPVGLRCTVNLDARQQLATDLFVAAQRGDVTQMSVGMIVAKDEWDAREENRTIFKLGALEDVSAVTYPASPTTSLQVAQRMLMDLQVESRERVRRMWAITRDLHDGRPVEPADIDVLSDGLRALAEADEATEIRAEEIDEERAEPTPQDKGIAGKIKAAHQGVVDAIHAQMGDADGATDPVDTEVMGHLHDAAKSLLKATGAQAVDGSSDIPPTVAAGSLAGDTGDIGVPSTSQDGNSTSAAYDNTGIRSALRRDLLEIEMRRHAKDRRKS